MGNRSMQSYICIFSTGSECGGGQEEVCSLTLDIDDCINRYCDLEETKARALDNNGTVECESYMMKCTKAYSCKCEGENQVFDYDQNCIEKHVSHIFSCFCFFMQDWKLDKYVQVWINDDQLTSLFLLFL